MINDASNTRKDNIFIFAVSRFIFSLFSFLKTGYKFQISDPEFSFVMCMKTGSNLENLDAYDQGRIDEIERFMKALEEGYKQATTKEELFQFMTKQIGPTDTEMEGMGNEQI